MKKVILLKTSCKILGEVFPLCYKEHLIGLISNPADGMNMIEMRRIEKVYDKLEAVDCPGHVLLEDAEHDTLREILEKTRFKHFDKNIKAMLEAVIASEIYEVPTMSDIAEGLRRDG